MKLQIKHVKRLSSLPCCLLSLLLPLLFKVLINSPSWNNTDVVISLWSKTFSDHSIVFSPSGISVKNEPIVSASAGISGKNELLGMKLTSKFVTPPLTNLCFLECRPIWMMTILFYVNFCEVIHTILSVHGCVWSWMSW